MTEEEFREELKKCAENPEGMHLCPKCNKEISNERAALINTMLCPTCSTPPPKIYGVVQYGHKTAGTLTITDSYRAFKFLKKTVNKQR